MRALLKSRDLRPVIDRTRQIDQNDILLFSTQRNERIRLPYFLEYYRRLGVAHFIIVDNGSTDGTAEYLAAQGDVSVWWTDASYKAARFGVDWLNHLQRRYGHGHWCLVADTDEFLVFPFCDTRPLTALTDWLDASRIRSFSAMQLDMYPEGELEAKPYAEGMDPLEIACWFDSGNYTISLNPLYRNLWIQGGPRARVFFRDAPERAPALNKVPLVKWHRRYAYVSSTHMLLPRGLNLVYETNGGEKASGVMLHAKFLDTFTQKAGEEAGRREHYADAKEYRAYHEGLVENRSLWCPWSERYEGWRQLELLGLMSKGNWA
jgi:hypothetical protein